MIRNDENNFGRVGVLMGGCSSEREISLKSGSAVLKSLVDAGIEAFDIVIGSEDDAVNQKLLEDYNIDIAFVVMHGRYGEDGGIQSLLERMNIEYVGSGPDASRLAINKVLTQNLLKKAGVKVANFCSFNKNDPSVVKKIQETFDGRKIVLKPASEGSSVGIVILKDNKDLVEALQRVFVYEDKILVEEFIEGRELTVGILGGIALPVVEIRSSHEFFDFEAKYQKGLTEYIVPAEIDFDMACQIQEIGMRTFHCLGCRDFARVDFMLSEDQQVYVLEINTIPGFTETSLLPMAAHCAGYDFKKLCVTLIKIAKNH